MENQLTIAIGKYERIKAGNKEVFSDEQLENLMEHFSPQDTNESTVFFKHFVSVYNPNTLGIKDRYIAFLKP